MRIIEIDRLFAGRYQYGLRATQRLANVARVSIPQEKNNRKRARIILSCWFPVRVVGCDTK